jgi:pyridinium-3,5-biscarboxylic acid mononucleotide sulfurtransferase
MNAASANAPGDRPGRDVLPDGLAVILTPLGSAAVAFSGGVDSSVALAAAAAVLGPENVVAVTAASETYLEEELATARAQAARLGVAHEIVATGELNDESFAANPPERCYHCKSHLVEALTRVAERHGCAALLDGANADDLRDHRPGMRAASEGGVRHPLLEAGLGKTEVRALARALDLPTWDRPANACLASRIPYGEPITAEKLRAIGAAEAGLRGLGFDVCRVRHHGPVARVELEPGQLGRAAGECRERIVAVVRAAGFAYVALDLEGFRSGSMNEVLPHGGEGREGPPRPAE